MVMEFHDWDSAGHSVQKALFLQATTGVMHPSARKYRSLNDRVAQAVAAYGRSEVHVGLLVYLRSIAYLSHS